MTDTPFLFLTIATAFAVCASKAHAFILEGFVPVVPNHKGGGGHEQKPLTLTCAVNFTDHYKKDYSIVHSIAVTISERPSEYTGGKSSVFKFIGGHDAGGLTATVDIYSHVGGPVVVAFTERAGAEKGCYPEDFGSFLTHKSNNVGYHGAGYGYGGYNGYGGYGNGYGGYGDYSGYNSYGGYGSYGGHGYGGYYEAGFGGGHGHDKKEAYDDIPGVIAKVNMSPGTVSSVTVDTLGDYGYLAELAGRGVVVCPVNAIKDDKDGTFCDGGILSCCALHYDDDEQRLYGKY